METKLTDRPTEQVIAAIEALDLESVKLRIMDPKLGEGWTREYADRIGQAYKVYLSMLAKHPDHAEDILLSEDVDEFWHTHILQTIKYTDDCEAVFGKYLHHAPHVGEVTSDDIERRVALAEITRRLYQEEFGDTTASDAAWLGRPVQAEAAAYSGATIQAGKAAYSGATIRADGAAYSGARIKAESAAYSGATIFGKAAYSGATIRADGAAYSGARIKAESAAYSGATILGKAAYSGATIRADGAAYSGARIKAESAAYSGARIKAESAAYSGAGIDAGKAAYSGATIRPDAAAYSGARLQAEGATPVAGGLEPRVPN
jgi:hypothetical protein